MHSPALKTWWVVVIAIVVASCGERQPAAQSEAEPNYVEGKRLAEAGRYSEAIIACQQALDLDSKHVDARLLLANIPDEAGAVRRLWEEYADRIVLFEDNLVALYGKSSS